MKKILIVAALSIGPTLVLAQGSAQAPARRDPRAVVPGHPDWRGQTVQIGPPHPSPDTGGLDPASLYKPLADQWPSYSGDLSGRRFSTLKHVNTATVKNLSLKWHNTLPTGCGPNGTAPAPAAPAAGGGRGGGRGGGGGGGSITPIVVGGLGTGEANNCGNRAPGGGVLFVNDVIYATSPFNVYAIDARDGTILWHYYWKTRG